MATPLYAMVHQPELDSPVLVVALKGWIDAGAGTDTAVEVLTDELDLQTVARFDADALLDWRARRPMMTLEEGLNTQVTWEETELSWAADREGNHLLLLLGNEPDHAWLSFSEQVVDLALDLGARLMVGLGSYPAAVPHTRPSLVAASASDPVLASGLLRTSAEVPTGIQGLIERRAAIRGLPAIGLWAQVPHYAAALPYPAASLVLLETASRVGGLALPTADLADRAARGRSRIDELIAQNPEHLTMLHQLEQQVDDQPSTMTPASGDELAAELERFLREQD